MRRSIVHALSALLLGATSTSCFAVADLDRFQSAKDTAGATSNFVDLRFTVRGMRSHVAELFEYRVVDASNVIQSRGFARPLGAFDATFIVKGAIPRQNGPFRLDFFADHDNSGGYDTARDQMRDHAWRLDLDLGKADDKNTLNILFDHNTSFTFLSDPKLPTEIGAIAKVHFTNMQGFVNKRVEMRVADASSRRVVALFRVPTIVDPTFDLAVPGMIEAGVTYAVEIYTDDGAAGGVRAFRSERDGTRDGLEVTFDGAAPGPEVTDAPSP